MESVNSEEHKINEAPAPPVIVINSSTKEEQEATQTDRIEGQMKKIDSVFDEQNVASLEGVNSKNEISGSVSSSSFEELNAETEDLSERSEVEKDEDLGRVVEEHKEPAQVPVESETPETSKKEIHQEEEISELEKVPETVEEEIEVVNTSVEITEVKKEVIEEVKISGLKEEETPVPKMRAQQQVPVAADRPIRRLSIARASMMTPKASPKLAKYMEPVRGRFVDFCSYNVLCVYFSALF